MSRLDVHVRGAHRAECATKAVALGMEFFMCSQSEIDAEMIECSMTPGVPAQDGKFGARFIIREVSPAENDTSPVDELAQAIIHTVEYVGLDVLRAVEGWSWFDAMNRHAPQMLEDWARKFLRDGTQALSVMGSSPPEQEPPARPGDLVRVEPGDGRILQGILDEIYLYPMERRQLPTPWPDMDSTFSEGVDDARKWVVVMYGARMTAAEGCIQVLEVGRRGATDG